MVPCPCNFRQGPEPHRFCDSLAFFQFAGGELYGVPLKGLQFSIAERGGVSAILYVDPHTSRLQAETLRRIAEWVLSLEGTPLTALVKSTISIHFGAALLSGSTAGGHARVAATVLKGNNNRSAIVVVNPIIFGPFPIKTSRKAVAGNLEVVAPGLSFKYYGTNANDADFEFLASSVR